MLVQFETPKKQVIAHRIKQAVIVMANAVRDDRQIYNRLHDELVGDQKAATTMPPKLLKLHESCADDVIANSRKKGEALRLLIEGTTSTEDEVGYDCLCALMDYVRALGSSAAILREISSRLLANHEVTGGQAFPGRSERMHFYARMRAEMFRKEEMFSEAIERAFGNMTPPPESVRRALNPDATPRDFTISPYANVRRVTPPVPDTGELESPMQPLAVTSIEFSEHSTPCRPIRIVLEDDVQGFPARRREG